MPPLLEQVRVIEGRDYLSGSRAQSIRRISSEPGELAVESRGFGKKECLTFRIFTDFYIEGKYRFCFFFHCFKALNKKHINGVRVCMYVCVCVRTHVSLG